MAASGTPGNLFLQPLPVFQDAQASGSGLSTDSYIAAAAANQDQHVVKGTPGQLYGLVLSNPSAAIRYVKVYDHAAPTSAQTPKLRFPLAANGGGVAREFSLGIPFAVAISIRITVGFADNDVAAATAGDVITNFEYK